jgi:hypothetical protein
MGVKHLAVAAVALLLAAALSAAAAAASTEQLIGEHLHDGFGLAKRALLQANPNPNNNCLNSGKLLACPKGAGPNGTQSCFTSISNFPQCGYLPASRAHTVQPHATTPVMGKSNATW